MMDALGDLLEPYSEVIAKVAGTITCLQFLSGIVLMKDIHDKGSSDVYPVAPFLGGIVLTVLSLKLGLLMGDQAMINVNLIGFVINVIFLIGFYFYASKEARGKIWTKLGYMSLFLLACIAYANFEEPQIVEFRLGMLVTAILVCLVGSPLLQLNEIIAKKSTEGLPFPIILAGNLVAASWMVYGLSIRNTVVVLQNLFLLILGGIQLALFAIYPSKPVKVQDKQKKSN